MEHLCHIRSENRSALAFVHSVWFLRGVSLVLFLALLTSCSSEGSSSVDLESSPGVNTNAVLRRVVDGDTIIVDFENFGEETIRLLGIDTPEVEKSSSVGECYGQEASDYLKALLSPGMDLIIARDVESRDSYERLLGHVYIKSDNTFINLALIQAGYARTLFIPPNQMFQNEFKTAEAQAKTAKVGLWKVC